MTNPERGMEPVAWMYDGPNGEHYIREHRDVSYRWLVQNNWTETPLYPHPAPVGEMREADEATVERVAQAIADAQFGGPFNGFEWPEAWDHFENLARAAIAALQQKDTNNG
jgi:hypothetical protein